MKKGEYILLVPDGAQGTIVIVGGAAMDSAIEKAKKVALDNYRNFEDLGPVIVVQVVATVKPVLDAEVDA